MNREARTQQDCVRRLGPVLGGSLACLALLATQVTAARGASPRSALTTAARSTCVPLTIDSSLVPDQKSGLTGVAALSPRDVWAVGYVQRLGSVNGTGQSGTRPLIEHWNGVRWQVIKIPAAPNTALSAVAAASAHDVWAVGSGAAWHWDGRRWCDETAGLRLFTLPHRGRAPPFTVASVTVSPHGTAFVAVETINRIPNNVLGVVYRSHAGWQPTGAPVGMHAPVPGAGLLTAARYPVLAAPGERDVWLANGFILNHWDGRRWALVRSPLFPLSMYRQANQKDVDAFATVSAHDIWALGRYILPPLPNTGAVPPAYHYGPLLAHWNGRSWRAVPSPLSALPQDKIGLAAIPDAATALATDDVWIERGKRTARWNGQRWQRYDLPRRTSAIMALAALSRRDVWGVGSLSPMCCWEPGHPAGGGPLIIHWNGTRWRTVASPMAPTVP
jgi:hypothetical protein